jgi:hypothetical protein
MIINENGKWSVKGEVFEWSKELEDDIRMAINEANV